MTLMIAIGSIFFWGNKNRKVSDKFKCPEDYASQEEYAVDLVKDASNYKKQNPDSPEDAYSLVRFNKLVENGCQKTLDNIKANTLEGNPYPDVSYIK